MWALIHAPMPTQNLTLMGILSIAVRVEEGVKKHSPYLMLRKKCKIML